MSMLVNPSRFATSGGGGGGGTVGAHRYWRFHNLYGHVGGDGFIMMNRLSAYDADGLVDYMTTATLTSTAPQDGTLAKLIDNNAGTYCQWNVTNFYIQLDMGAGNEVELTAFAFQGGTTGGYEGRSPGVFQYEYSDDGVTWTVAAIFYKRTNLGLSYLTLRTFTIPAFDLPVSWWGITVDYTTRGPTSIGTLAMYHAGGSNLALSVSNPDAINYYNGSYAPSKAFDGDPSTFYSSGDSSKPAFLFAELPSPASIDEMGISTRGDGFGASDAPQSGFVIASEDGVAFLPMWSYALAGWADVDTKNTAGPDADPDRPTYDRDISSGDRSAIITVTATNINAGASTPSKLVDGSQADQYWWTNATGDGSGYLKFALGHPYAITEFTFSESGSQTHGIWRFEGSNDDAAWTQIGSDFTLSPGPTSFTNTTAYSYYRLRHMTGARSQTPYLREVTFKSGPRQ